MKRLLFPGRSNGSTICALGRDLLLIAHVFPFSGLESLMPILPMSFSHRSNQINISDGALALCTNLCIPQQAVQYHSPRNFLQLARRTRRITCTWVIAFVLAWPSICTIPQY